MSRDEYDHLRESADADVARVITERRIHLARLTVPAPRSAALSLPGLGTGEQTHGPLFRAPFGQGVLGSGGVVDPSAVAPTPPGAVT